MSRTTQTVWNYFDDTCPDLPSSLLIIDGDGIPIGVGDFHDDECSSTCECKEYLP